MTMSLAPEVVATDSDDGLVLLDQRNGRYWHLNRSGAATLRLLLDGHSPDAAAAALAQAFPVAAEQTRADITVLLTALREAKLVVTP
jgi:hypothetical protein